MMLFNQWISQIRQLLMLVTISPSRTHSNFNCSGIRQETHLFWTFVRAAITIYMTVYIHWAVVRVICRHNDISVCTDTSLWRHIRTSVYRPTCDSVAVNEHVRRHLWCLLYCKALWDIMTSDAVYRLLSDPSSTDQFTASFNHNYTIFSHFRRVRTDN